MYLKGDIDDNRPHQQHQCDLSWLSSMLILIDIVVVLIVQDDNENVIVVYKTVSSMITPLAVTATLIEMFWCTTTFQKECHTVCLTVDTTVRNQHTLTLNQNYIDVQQLMSSYLIHVQTEHSHQTAQEWLLSEKSECTEWAAADQQRELNLHQQSQGWEQQCTHCKEWGPCELSASRHVLVWHLHCCCCCWCCCCWACHTKVSADIFNQERFHIQKLWVKKLKKKEKEKLYMRWGNL